MDYKQAVLEHYDAEISEEYLSHGLNLEEISTEDGYYFYALRESRDNYCMYYQREESVYEEIRSQIESGGSIGCVDIDQIQWDLMYEEIVEEIQDQVETEIKLEVLNIIKPTVITELYKRLSTSKEYKNILAADDMDAAAINDFVNERVLKLFSNLNFK